MTSDKKKNYSNEGHRQEIHPTIHLQRMKNTVRNKNLEKGPEEQERKHVDSSI